MKHISQSAAPKFSSDFQDRFETLLRWRRDVRRFKPDPLPKGSVEELLRLAALAPSVGNSQPWRFVRVEDKTTRHAIRDHFEACNADALNDYAGEKAKLYASLKLSGMDIAPTQIAVFCDRDTDLGLRLGLKTMPESLDYSVTMAVLTLWLAARAKGIGVGWVSIVEPEEVKRVLDVPESWKLVAYLCIGWPEEEHEDPELVRHGWQKRVNVNAFTTTR